MYSVFTILAALSAAHAAPVSTPFAGSSISDSWIAKLDPSATAADLQNAIASLGVDPTHTYNFGDFVGFSFKAKSEPSVLRSKVPAIVQMEPDQVVAINSPVTQRYPPYGLARISHRTRGASTYDYDSSAGTGTFAYVIDTGIYVEHNEFQGRASFGTNFADNDNTDRNGHGTHVAGTIGGVTFGVAKNTTLIAVKVFGADGRGTLSAVIAALEWSVNDAKNNGRIGKSVANLSLGGGFSQMLNDAAAEAVKQGLFVAVAAGNGDANGVGQPVKTASPASAPQVCTIAAIDENDVRASFSNYGNLVDVFAPGVNVQSAFIGGPDTSAYLSGTSMATPHVAGLGAYFLGLPLVPPAKGGDALCTRIKRSSTKDAVANPRSSNRLAYNNAVTITGQGVTWG